MGRERGAGAVGLVDLQCENVNYPDSVRFLYALGNEIKTAKLGLDRMTALCAELGHPERAFQAVHVAGTNGKGSTAAMIEAGLRAAGVFAGLFTSPHLVEPTERIRIGGTDVAPATFADAFAQVHQAAERLLDSGVLDLHPTYFETVTAMAFVLFRAAGVQTAVIEVGLGGRLDATNVLPPGLCVITPVDFDHEAYLGNTIEAIASEKAGILKPGSTAVFARQRPEAEIVLERTAREMRINFDCTTHHTLSGVHVDARGSVFMLDGERLACSLAGEHQVENAAVAALALRQLGVPAAGIANARWPGRLERIKERPEMILDGAHNPAGARALAAYIERFYAERRMWLIYGTMRDKAIDEVVSTLFPLAHEIIATAPQSARALRAEALRDLWSGENLTVTLSLAEAIGLVKGRASADDAVFITGSLFLVGEARETLA